LFKQTESSKKVVPLKALIACHVCDMLQRTCSIEKGFSAKCSRCGTVLYQRKPNSINRTLALVIAGLILYIPANLYPIMSFELFGQTQTNTIWTGVRALYSDGMWAIATLVFCASLIIPLLKLLGLLYLCFSIKFSTRKNDKTILYRIVDSIGRWSMLDVFLLSILVAVVKLGQLATVSPEKGSLFFAAVVVITLFASSSFDPRLIWDKMENPK
jgi:paraquat-inducible protein A